MIRVSQTKQFKLEQISLEKKKPFWSVSRSSLKKKIDRLLINYKNYSNHKELEQSRQYIFWLMNKINDCKILFGILTDLNKFGGK